MTAKLHKIDTAANENSQTPAQAAEASAVEASGDREDVLTSTISGQATRHWLIAANVAAWLLIFLVVRLMFF